MDLSQLTVQVASKSDMTFVNKYLSIAFLCHFDLSSDPKVELSSHTFKTYKYEDNLNDDEMSDVRKSFSFSSFIQVIPTYMSTNT